MGGGAVGALDMHLFQHSAESLGAFALVGMGAVFAGIIRAPITSVLIIVEMTGGYSLILPLMIANMLAYGIARHYLPTPIYDALVEQDGARLHERLPLAEALDGVTLRQAHLDERRVELLAREPTMRNSNAAPSRVSRGPLGTSLDRDCPVTAAARVRQARW